MAQYALTFLPCLILGRMFDTGWFKIPQFLASATLVAATVLTAECKEYWQFILCQGFLVGVSTKRYLRMQDSPLSVHVWEYFRSHLWCNFPLVQETEGDSARICRVWVVSRGYSIPDRVPKFSWQDRVSRVVPNFVVLSVKLTARKGFNGR